MINNIISNHCSIIIYLYIIFKDAFTIKIYNITGSVPNCIRH